MPVDVSPWAIHATAVAIAGEALLILGPSCAGKSRLACALMARATRRWPITLIGDDRILLHSDAGSLVARPHPRIAGFVERRGLGIVALPWTAEAKVGGLVDLGPGCGTMLQREEDGHLDIYPHLEISEPFDARERAEIVLAWWPARIAARAPHPAAKTDDAFWRCTKD